MNIKKSQILLRTLKRKEAVESAKLALKVEDTMKMILFTLVKYKEENAKKKKNEGKS